MSTMLMSQEKAEPESEMLPQDPPPRIIRGIAWLLVAIFFAGLIAAITFHLPETVSAPFVLVPQNGADPIQSSRLAVVSAVKVSEGEAVKAGQELMERMETLAKSGGVSQMELIRLRLEVAGSEKDLSVAQRNLQQVNLDRQRMETEHARLRDEQVAEIEKLKFRVTALKSDLENSELNMLSVRAPYDGVVISLAQRNAGSVVQNGQELCQLARIDAKPHARLLFGEAALPKLAVGQRVRFFFTAFPYQRYGAVDAKLNWISPSAVSSPDGSHFVGLASL